MEGLLVTIKQFIFADDDLFRHYLSNNYENRGYNLSFNHIIQLRDNHPILEEVYLIEPKQLEYNDKIPFNSIIINIFTGHYFINVYYYFDLTNEVSIQEEKDISLYRQGKASGNKEKVKQKSGIEEIHNLSLNAESLYLSKPNYISYNLEVTYPSISSVTEVYSFLTIPLGRRFNIMWLKNEESMIRIADNVPKLEELYISILTAQSSHMQLKIYSTLGYLTAYYRSEITSYTLLDLKGLQTKQTPKDPESFFNLEDLEQELFNSMLKLTPFIDEIPINRAIRTNISAKWNLYDLSLDINLFLYAITTGLVPDFSLNEMTPYIFRKDIPLVFSMNGVEYYIVLHTKQILAEEIGYNRLLNEVYIANSKEEYAVTISVENVRDQYSLDSLILYIGIRIIDFIDNQQQNVLRTFSTLLDTNYELVAVWSNKTKNKLKQLQSVAPEMFVNGYAKACQEQNQGVVIPEDKLSDWIKQGKNYITYPKNADAGPQVHYGCPDAKFPYPGLKINMRLDNNKKYPELPCCYAYDQKAKPNSIYSIYMSGNKRPTDINTLSLNKGLNKQINSTDRLLPSFRKGTMPRVLIDNLVRKGLTADFVRMGVYESVNSFIHCVFLAVNYETYISKDDILERDNIVKEWRKNKALTRNYNAIMQEMHGYNSEDISDMILNEEKEFSSEHFYRFLEVEFDVNIFVFVEDPPSSQARLEIPRAKIVHIREPRIDRKTVLVYKHYLVKENPEAHYELIVTDKYLHSTTTSNKMFNYMSDTYNCIIIDTPNIYKNIYNKYSIVAYLSSLGFKLAGQYLDNNNKCRGYICRAPNGEAGSILCMPQQPLDLGVYRTIYNFTDQVLTLFGTPSRANYNKKSQLEGLWYPVENYDLGYYICLKPTALTNYTNLNRASNPLVISDEEGDFSLHISKENELEFLLTLLTELFRRFGRERLANIQSEFQRFKSRITTPIDLKQTFMANANSEEDREAQLVELRRREALLSFKLLFKVGNVRYRFNTELLANIKQTTSFDAALAILRGTNLIHNSSIYFESEELMLNMDYFVEKHLVTQPKSFYEYNYESGKYFLFSSMLEFTIWIDSQVKPNYIINSATELENQVMSIETDQGGNFIVHSPKPRFYLDPTGVFLIVQNVVYGDLGRALFVAQKWKQSRRNAGYHVESFLPRTTPHNVYLISGKELMGTNVNESYISVIRYKDGSYAALLPIN